MTEAAEMAHLDALVESALACARAQGAVIPKNAEDVFRFGFVSGLEYVVRSVAENNRKEKS